MPAIVRTATEQEQLEFAIIENVQREDLNAIERARAYQSLIDSFVLTHDDIARRVGKSRVSITNTLRLLNLPPSVQKALQDDQISEGHARVLLSLASVRYQRTGQSSPGSSVRQTEILVNRLNGKQPISLAHPAQPCERDLGTLRSFHTKVTCKNPKWQHHNLYYSDEIEYHPGGLNDHLLLKNARLPEKDLLDQHHKQRHHCHSAHKESANAVATISTVPVLRHVDSPAP